MWIVSALLILAAWTAVGFLAAVLFFRLGFGFEVRRGDAEPTPRAKRKALEHADAVEVAG